MEIKDKSANKILKLLLRSIWKGQTITSVAKEIGMSRVGAWKQLKKMQTSKLISLSPVGSGKTSTYNINLNWNNPLLEKILSFSLTEEALDNKRWLDNFAELENKVDFLILYGSMLHSPKEANDIDILNIITNKNKFIEIEKIISQIQKIQIKKIHAINYTQQEFKQELYMPNKIFLDAVKKGIILFGQDKFIKFIKCIADNGIK